MPWMPEPADPRVARELLRLFYEQSRYSMVAGSFMVLLQSVYAATREPRWLWLAWAAAFALLMALRWRWRLQVLAATPQALDQAAPRWRARALFTSGAAGLLWALAFALNFDAADLLSQMFCVVLACLTCVASVNVMAPLPRAYVALLVMPVLALAALFAAANPNAVGAGLVLMTAVAAALSLGLVRAHVRLLIEGLAMRYEREQLLAQAQAARDAQVRFMAAASHDLRQPVHALGLLAAQAQAEMQGRRAQQTAAQLEGMAQALDALVGNLLDISRLDAGAVTPKVLPVNLDALFDRLAPEFAVLADAKNLHWRLRPSGLWVFSDESQLERMLRNLLGNALRYTERGGVLLAARKRRGRVRIEVWDTGPGIAPEHQSRVFDEFVQLANPGRDRSRGHGLGLAIVARLARLLGHRVSLRSRLGAGSGFLIELDEAPAIQPEPSTEPLPQPLHGRRVALVEDDDAVREATVSLLQTWGCQVWADASASPLLERLRANGAQLDAVVSDWRLPEGDGLLAIERLRAHAGRRVPALLISGETLPLSPQALQAQHVVAVRKPLPPSALRAWLGSAEFRQ